MDNSTAAVRVYFSKLGLANAVADIYLSLYSYGPQTISQLARTSKVERTRIYRLIDQLMESNLIELEAGQGTRGIIKAAPIANIRILINQRQEALANLQDELELIEGALARNSLSNPAIRLQTYTGQIGLRQILENITSASSRQEDMLSIHCHTIQPLESIEGSPENWRQSFSALIRDKRIALYVKEIVFPAQFIVYNNVVAYLDWTLKDFYGTEIYNEQIAETQRQLLFPELRGNG